jgi:hypothetical protein
MMNWRRFMFPKPENFRAEDRTLPYHLGLVHHNKSWSDFRHGAKSGPNAGEDAAGQHSFENVG